MDKLKNCIARSLSGDEPSQEDISEAINEVADVVSSIARSLERIADVAEAAAHHRGYIGGDPARV